MMNHVSTYSFCFPFGIRVSRLVARLYRVARSGECLRPTSDERRYADLLIATYGKLD